SHLDLHSFPTRRSSDLARSDYLAVSRPPHPQNPATPAPLALSPAQESPPRRNPLAARHDHAHDNRAWAQPSGQNHASGHEPLARSEEHTSELQSRENLV